MKRKLITYLLSFLLVFSCITTYHNHFEESIEVATIEPYAIILNTHHLPDDKDAK